MTRRYILLVLFFAVHLFTLFIKIFLFCGENINISNGYLFAELVRSVYSLSVDCICHTVSISVGAGYTHQNQTQSFFFLYNTRRIIPDVIYLCCCHPRVSFFYSRAMLNCSFTPRIYQLPHAHVVVARALLSYTQQAIAVGCCLYYASSLFLYT